MFRNPLADGAVLLILVLLFFGPKRLPMLSRSIGESVKELKGGLSRRGSHEQELEAATEPVDQPTGSPSRSGTPTA